MIKKVNILHLEKKRFSVLQCVVFDLVTEIIIIPCVFVIFSLNSLYYSNMSCIVPKKKRCVLVYFEDFRVKS